MKKVIKKTKHVYYNNIAPVYALPAFYIKRAYKKPSAERKVYLWLKRKAKWSAIIALLSLAILAGRLNTHLNKSEATVSELKGNNLMLSTKLDDCNYSKEQFAAQLVAKDAELVSKTDELGSSKARVAELEAQVAELNNQVSTKDAELSRLKVYSYSK